MNFKGKGLGTWGEIENRKRDWTRDRRKAGQRQGNREKAGQGRAGQRQRNKKRQRKEGKETNVSYL